MGASGTRVVLGAAGGIGSAVLRELARQGRTVRAVGRRAPEDLPAGTEWQTADVREAQEVYHACSGAALVYHCAQPAYERWPQEFPALNRAVVEGVAAAGAKLVFADNLYLYGPAEGPLGEDLPARATGPNGRTRALLAEELLDAHRTGRLRVTLGRASDYYGPNGLGSVAGEQVFGSALRGRRVRWPLSLDIPHTLHFLDDVARGLIVLGDRPEANGLAWHLPAAEPITGRRFLELVFAAAGRPARVGVLPPLAVSAAALFVPFLRAWKETLYQWRAPFVVDASRFERAFGPWAATPHEQAVRATVDWFRRRATSATA